MPNADRPATGSAILPAPTIARFRKPVASMKRLLGVLLVAPTNGFQSRRCFRPHRVPGEIPELLARAVEVRCDYFVHNGGRLRQITDKVLHRSLAVFHKG